MSEAAPLAVVGVALGAVVVLVALFALLPRWGARRDADMPLLAHAAELRRRALVAVGALFLFTVLVFSFGFREVEAAGLSVPVPVPSVRDNLAAQTYRVVVEDVVPTGVDLVLLRPMDALVIQLQVTFFLALLLALPVVAYQVLAFLAPGLLPRERRLVAIMVPLVTLFFAAGAAFAYFAVLPFLVAFLYGYAAGLGAAPLLAATELVGFVLLVVVLFGLAFELPVAMMGLARLGWVAPRTFARYWRHAALAIFVLAALVTPDPTIVSQLIVGSVLFGLYLAGLGLSRLASRRVRASD